MGSKILKTGSEENLLHNWVVEAIPGKLKYQLLWQGTRDGFGAGNFHTNCNNKGPTVTVIVSNNDKIFGGYTSVAWESRYPGRDGYVQDTTAFIYSLTNKAKCATQKNSNSIYDGSGAGPWFGHGHDIIIYDNCNARSDNYCESQASDSTYALPPGADNNFLAGSRNFTVKEIEVYAVIKQ